MPVDRELAFVNDLRLEGAQAVIAEQILREIRARLGFLQSVGLRYLTLSRAAATLSGGEAQRIRLATQIGSSLDGRALYPRRAEHRPAPARQRQAARHAAPPARPRATRSSSSSTMRTRSARRDYIVDVGPGAGVHGGQIMAQGTLQDIMNAPDSPSRASISPVSGASPSRRSGAPGNGNFAARVRLPREQPAQCGRQHPAWHARRA